MNWSVRPAYNTHSFLSFPVYSTTLVFRLAISIARTNPPSAISGIPGGRRTLDVQRPTLVNPRFSSGLITASRQHCVRLYRIVHAASRRCLARHWTTNLTQHEASKGRRLLAPSHRLPVRKHPTDSRNFTRFTACLHWTGWKLRNAVEF